MFFLWKHGKNRLKSSTENINKVFPTIKITAEWSKISITFLDVTVSYIKVITETALYVRLTNSRHYLQATSCYTFHCKNGILYSQTLRFPPLFNQCCWLSEHVQFLIFFLFLCFHNIDLGARGDLKSLLLIL